MMAMPQKSGVLPDPDPELVTLFDDLMTRAEHTLTRDVALDEKVWDAIVESGVDRLTSPGGAGASWLEATQLLRAATGVAVPVAEHDLLAGWVADCAGLGDVTGISSLGFLDSRGVACEVPWAHSVAHIVLVRDDPAGAWVTRVSSDIVDIEPGRNLAGHERDTVVVDLERIERHVISPSTVRALRLRAKLARLVQVTGALDRAVQQSVEHTMTRMQFGRPLAKFQAVQHLIADAAGEAHLARTAVDVAVAQLLVDEADLDALERRVAVAASVAGHAASVVTRNAHQAHGAIGTTIEHSLHRATLSALAWRNEYGTVVEWDAAVSSLFHGEDRGVWASVVSAGASVIPTATTGE